MTEFEQKALHYAEEHGIIEYGVNGHLMEYLSFYGQEEGWWYVIIDLESMREIYRGQAFPWMGFIPYWLKAENGGLRYNYMEG